MKKHILIGAFLAVTGITQIALASERYQVEEGENLWQIAQHFRASDTSSSQVIVAIYKKNPKAFNYSNINSLKPGADLEIPSMEEIDAVSKQEAAQVLASQEELWKSRERHEQVKASDQVEPDAIGNKITAVQSRIEAVEQEIKEVIGDLKNTQEAFNNSI